MLDRQDQGQSDVGEKVLSGIRERVNPFIEKLRNSRLSSQQMNYIDIIESNLSDLISPFSHKISSRYSGFTPTEIQVAGLVRDGKTTKDIAEVMNLSPRTVEVHRKNIRKKMGLTDKKVNLRSYLLTFE